MERDVRSFCVALVADELVNDSAAGFDALDVLDRAGWGVIALPPAWYPESVAAPLLEQIAEHIHEFTSHGYAVALVGRRAGLEAALTSVGLTMPESIVPGDPAELEAALAARAAGRAPDDAAAAQRAGSAGRAPDDAAAAQRAGSAGRAPNDAAAAHRAGS